MTRGNKSTKEETLALALQIWELRTGEDRLTQNQIAERLNISQSVVAYHLNKHGEKVLKEIEKRARIEKSLQLETLQYIADDALREWKRSKSDGKKYTEKRRDIIIKGNGGGKDKSYSLDDESDDPRLAGEPKAGELVETKDETRGRLGDPRFLLVAVKALEDRRRILGIGEGDEGSAAPPVIIRVPLKITPENWIQQTRPMDAIDIESRVVEDDESDY